VWYRLLTGDGELIEEGDAVAELAGGALVISPPYGQVLRVAPADIVEIGEPEPYAVRLVLAEGPVLDLLRLGPLRTQILAELAEARADTVAGTLLLDGVGRPETFPGTVDEVEAELRLYDDALVVLPVRGEPDKVPYPFIDGIDTDPSGYRISVRVAGRDPLSVHRLARRTTEFLDLLGARHRTAAGRTAAFLGALLPGLGPVALRSVAGQLRDGLAGPRTGLDAVDPTVWPALTGAATRPERVAGLSVLAGLGPTWIGFKQLVSVERPASGGQPWRDPAITPDLGDHQSGGSSFGGGSFGGGIAGIAAAGLVAGGPPTGLGFDGPFQAMGSVLAYQMLGGSGFGGSGFGGSGFGGSGFGGSGFGNHHTMLPRADVRRGRLTPAHTDFDALAAAGDAPTVLAFVLCLTGSGRLVYEVLNEPDHATYVYRAAEVATVNRALDLLGFRVEGVYADAESAGSRYRKAAERLPALRVLRDAYLGRVGHGDGWADRLAALLA
jgi:hypothetical protein